MAGAGPFGAPDPPVTEVTARANTYSAGASDVLYETSFRATDPVNANEGFVQLVGPAGTRFSTNGQAYRLVDGSQSNFTDPGLVVVNPGGAGENVVDVYLPGSVAVAAGDKVELDAAEVGNPGSPQEGAQLSVSTSSDTQAVPVPFPIGPATTVSDFTLSSSAFSAASKDVVDRISLKAATGIFPGNPCYYCGPVGAGFVRLIGPTGLRFSHNPGAYHLVDGSQSNFLSPGAAVVSPGGAGENVVDVYLPGNLQVTAGDTVELDAYEVSNPAGPVAGGELSVSTSSDINAVSKPFPIGPESTVSDVMVSTSSSSAGANDTVDRVSLRAASEISPGNPCYYCGPVGGGFVQLVAPAGSRFSANPAAYRLVDGSQSNFLSPGPAVVNPEGVGNNVVDVHLPSGMTVAPGDTVELDAYEVSNPAGPVAGGELSVSTSADAQAVAKPFPIGPASAVDELSSGLSSGSYSEQFIAHTAIITGNPCYYCGAVGSGFVVFTAPEGTTLPTASSNYQFGVATVATGASAFEAASVQVSGQTATIYVGGAIPAGSEVTLTISGLSSPGPGEVSLATSSDTVPVTARTVTLAPLNGTVSYQHASVAGASVEACPTAGGRCTTTTSGSGGAFHLGVSPVAGTDYSLTASPPAFGVHAAEGRLSPVSIPGPEGRSGVAIALSAAPTLASGVAVISPNAGEETSATANPGTFWGQPFQLKLEPALFPKHGTVLVTQVVVHGIDANTDEHVTRTVDVGGSIGGNAVGIRLGTTPITVEVPALRPIHGEVNISVNYRVYPSSGPIPAAGVTSTQILYEIYPPPKAGGEVPTDPLPAYFVNYGDPAGISIGPGKIVGKDARYFEIIPLASYGVPPETRDCGFGTEELYETFAGASASPPPGTQCGIAVRFTPPAVSHRIFYYATLEATASDKGLTPNTIPVALVGCDSRVVEDANLFPNFGECSNSVQEWKTIEKLQEDIKRLEEELANGPTREERTRIEEEIKEREEDIKEIEEESPGEPQGPTIAGIGMYVDPSGTVYVKTEHGAVPLAGATVTLRKSYTPSGEFEAVPNGSSVMSPANRVNPGITDVSGGFGWDVLSGYYNVTASKTGCTSETSSLLTVPPPVTALSLTLNCATPPVLATTATSVSASSATSGYGEAVTFAAEVTGAASPSGTVTFYSGGSAIGSGVVQGSSASMTTAALPVGEHSITAAYSGDGANQPSGSGAVKEIVTTFAEAPGPPDIGRCSKLETKTGKFSNSGCQTQKSGGGYEWTPGVGRPNFTLAGTVLTLESVAGKKLLECKGVSGSGEDTTARRLRATITLTGCAAAGSSCSSETGSAGEIHTNVLAGVLGWEDKAHAKVDLELFPASPSGPLLQAKCAGSTLTVKGGVLVPLKTGKSASAMALKFKQARGHQKPEHLEGGAAVSLKTSVGGAAALQSGLGAQLTLTSEEAIDVNANF